MKASTIIRKNIYCKLDILKIVKIIFCSRGGKGHVIKYFAHYWLFSPFYNRHFLKKACHPDTTQYNRQLNMYSDYQNSNSSVI